MDASDPTRHSVEPAASFSESVPTLAEVLVRLETVPGITDSRRRDLISAVRRTAAVLDRNPAALPADPAQLRPLLASVNAARVRVSPQTWANLRSCLAAALRLTAGNLNPSPRLFPLSLVWSELLDSLPDRQIRVGLSRFARFCSAAGTEPSLVDEALLERFGAHLRTDTLCPRPSELLRRTAVMWNRALAGAPGAPARPLTVPSFRKPRGSLRLEELLASFVRDTENYLNWSGGSDPFGDHVPPHVCKPRTLALRRKQIELMASALIHRGIPLAKLRTLADLVEVEHVKEILRAYVRNQPDRISAFTRDLARTLLHIAKHWVRVPPEHLERLRDLNQRLGPERSGLTVKNQTVLRQFDDPKMLQQLLMLPQRLMMRARRLGAGNRRAAIAAQLAVAVEILLMAPIRINNLIGLRLGEHLVRPGGSKAPFHLILPAEEVKNAEPMEFALPPQSSALMDEYIRVYRPAVAGPEDPWLFTTAPGKPKGQSTLSKQITGIIWCKAGIRLTPHQFRHLAAKLLLIHDPGNFEATRRLLGHKNSRTTTNFYSGMQTKAAAAHYDSILLRQRQRLIAVRPVRRPRRP